MKLNAYILAADPAWIEASVLSYYDLVDRIVVSFDRDHLSWTGKPIAVAECLERVRAIDHAGKCVMAPGAYFRAGHAPLENDTYQRQCALDQAGVNADWVLQLDTDEVVADSGAFAACIEEAQSRGRDAVNYPSIWLYTRASGRWYLEWCRRGWQRGASYPGPVAVRAKTTLSHCRRVEAGHFHVDLSQSGSMSRVPNGIAVDKVISSRQAIYHFSYVRTEQWLRKKFSAWGHANDRDWHPEVLAWLGASRHPIWSSLSSQWRRGGDRKPLRLTRIPQSVQRLLEKSSMDRPQAAVAGVPMETVSQQSAVMR